MPLEPPKLDDRDFESLFREARARIPRYLPEWTDYNPSDPGITLLQLHAWLTETILYRLNQLPEVNHVKFLQLLGVEQRPACPARAELTFILKENLEQRNVAEVLVPERTIVGVSARDLEEPLSFETESTLRAITARLARLIRVSGPPPTGEDVTQANDFSGDSFAPFGDPPQAGAMVLLGFRSNLPFPRQEIGLQIYLPEEGQELLASPAEAVCGPEGSATPRVTWQWWNGLEWEALDVTADETRNLTQNGQVYFKVTGQIPTVSYTGLQRSHGDWSELELGDDLYYWLRVVLESGTYARTPKLDSILTNTVRATAALTVFDEAVGSSSGTPNQVMTLRHSPVLAEPPLTLEVDEGEGPKPWEEVSDFFGSGPNHPHYVLNRTSGQISFGDGRRGRIPVAGQFNVIARHYRYGGGRIGNVGAGTITDLTSPLTEVEEVVNYRPAFDGDDEEPLSDTMLRAPREIKARDRAVTLEDFALLAKETPGALVARAYAYVTDSNGMDSNGGRIINVVIVPQSQEARPVPDEAARRRVCRYLDERRLITTQVRVKGPKYHDIDVIVDVRARADADLKEVKNAIDARLAGYFHPLRGGEDGKGWPFGRDVYYSELLREIMVISGVVRVEELKLRKLLESYADEEQAESEKDGLIQAEGEAFPDACVPSAEVIRVVEEAEDDSPQEVFYVAAVYDCCDLPVAEGALVALRRAEIAVSYDRRGGR